MNTSSPNARLRPFRPVPFGRYTLLSQLATGGMGEIFLARLEGAQGFEKLCVIKKILPQLAEDPEFVERFVGEARTLVKLSHGSIAQVLDMGLHEGEAYMALEYVDGKDLRKVAARARDRQKTLPLTFVLFVMSRVLDALAYAHRKKGDDESELNLVHRDISPQNILISYEGEVKVIDFGLAKSRLNAAKTNPSIILGKFLYMSPEQARHQQVDRRSDLYAVGLCLYELISGRNPFDLLPPGELLSAVSQPNIPPLLEVAPSVPPSVAQLVMKALEVEPAQRFQTAEELRGKLNACMLELDPSAGPESVSRYMHELFDPEYLAERRMLTNFREVGRAPEPEPVVIGMPEGVPTRPVPTLPPKTIRLDGPVEPLSFMPTPRARDGNPVPRDEEETRPAVVVGETTRPDVDVQALEDTPSSSEPLQTEPPAPLPLEVDAGEVTSPATERLGAEDEEDVGFEDTQPRIQVPQSLLEDTQPRIVLPSVYYQDTQPRVVLDESLLRDTEQQQQQQQQQEQQQQQQEVSQGDRPRPRRRVASTRVPVVTPRAPSSSRVAAVSPRSNVREGAGEDAPGEEMPSVAREMTRRTAVPARPGPPWGKLLIAVALLLTALGVGAVALFSTRPSVKVAPPPVRPRHPPSGRLAQEPASPSPSVPQTTAPITGQAIPEEDAGTDLEEDQELLAPLASSSGTSASSAPSKPSSQRKRLSARNSSILQKEWARTQSAFKALTRVHACESLDFLCSRYEELEAEVVGMGDVENSELLGKVRALHQDIQKRKDGS